MNGMFKSVVRQIILFSFISFTIIGCSLSANAVQNGENGYLIDNGYMATTIELKEELDAYIDKSNLEAVSRMESRRQITLVKKHSEVTMVERGRKYSKIETQDGRRGYVRTEKIAISLGEEK
jgi:hypothetical protein